MDVTGWPALGLLDDDVHRRGVCVLGGVGEGGRPARRLVRGHAGAWANANLGVLVALAIGFVVTVVFSRATVRAEEEGA
jgi:hypothetical protein